MSASITSLHADKLAKQANISHVRRNLSLEESIDSIKNKIKTRGDLPYASMTHQLKLVDELAQFEIGKFLLQTGGLNGYWTHYAINHPQRGRLTGINSENKSFTSLESFLLDKAPTALATQQRFEIFKQEIQKRLHDEMNLASIPCGLMAELLDLDFSQLTNFSILGVDIDSESLTQSQQLAKSRELAALCTFIEKDAWDLNRNEEFDLITSNGLSIYEPDEQKIIALYRQFFSALKPKGWLITSFLSPPPTLEQQTEWDLKMVNSEDALLQKILFVDILEGKWQVFRSEQTVRSQIEQAGFEVIEILYDKAHIFPTVIAKKN
jgi:SAM-dependent methyltransferase